MKDIPVFDTEYGVASLVLREIPYRQRAYIKLLSTLEPEKLLQECRSFCRMCGAEEILATGHPCLEQYGIHATLVLMKCSRLTLGESDACLFPVTEQTLTHWVQLYNARMAQVPNAAYMDQAAARELLKTGGGYFVHRDGRLLGIGKISGDSLDAVVAAEPGMGETVVKALAGAIDSDTVQLLVALENQKAIRLYTRLGFAAVQEISKWFKIC